MMVQAMPTDDEQGDRSLMDKHKQLRLKSNGSPEDERLLELIIAVSDAPKGTFKHQRALHNLIKSVQVILKGFKSWENFNQEADTGFNRSVEYDPLVYLSQNIDDFIPTGKTIKTSLTGWLKHNTVFPSIDEYRQQQRQNLNPISIDVPITAKHKDGGSETIEREISDSSLTGLDLLLSLTEQNFKLSLKEYMTTDPEGKLKNCAMNSPQDHCNCFTLVELRFFREEPLNRTQAAKALGLNSHDGLRSHWDRKCRPLLQQVAKEIAQNNGWEID
jgi:hypothetical protein